MEKESTVTQEVDNTIILICKEIRTRGLQSVEAAENIKALAALIGVKDLIP